MKIRQSFVSNSSSSSFVCIMRKDAFDKRFADADPKTRFIINQAVTSEDEIVFGIPCVIIKDFSTPSGDSMWGEISLPQPENGENDEDEDDPCDFVYSCINEFIDSFEKDECSSFSISDG